jgi:hypothetical protein
MKTIVSKQQIKTITVWMDIEIVTAKQQIPTITVYIG